MSLLAPLLLFAPPTTTWDASVAAHAALRSASVQIAVGARLPGRVVSTRHHVRFVRGGSLLLTTREAPQKGKAGTDRTYYLRGRSLVAHDAMSNEFLRRTLPARKTPLERMEASLGTLDEPVRVLLSPAAMRATFARFRNLGSWRTLTSAKETVLSRRTGSGAKASTMELVFGRPRPLLRSLLIRTPNSELRWTMTHAVAPKALAYAVPKGALRVSSFLEAPEAPRAASAQAAAVTRGLLRALATLRTGTIRVRDEGGTARLVIAPGKAREDKGVVSWAYDGWALTIQDGRHGHFYRGKTKRRGVTGHLAAVGIQADPILRSLLARRVPYQGILAAEMTASLAGQATVDGVPCDMLRLSSPRTRISAIVRRTDRLLQGMTTEALGPGGRTLFTSTRRFTYQGLGTSPPNSEFLLQPKPGQRVMPLPKTVR